MVSLLGLPSASSFLVCERFSYSLAYFSFAMCVTLLSDLIICDGLFISIFYAKILV